MRNEEEFQEFYRKNLRLSEEEFQIFFETLKIPLPKTFRVLKNFQHDYKKVSFNFEKTVTSLKNSTIFTTNNPSKFLLNAGFIYAQELVSTLPVLLVSLSKNDIVLDMCASPGSKSTQISDHVKLLIANDVASNRLNTLITNLKKTPTPNLVVTRHDASKFPFLKIDNEKIFFDKIFCDVPCTSDGTLRKNSSLKWSVEKSVKAAQIQFSILKRAAKLVKENGIVIYSTCSLNPIENEVIVQKFLLENEFEILEVPKILKFRAGLVEWDPCVARTPKNEWLFPIKNEELKKCVRVLPHDQNTGGFFIAVLKKKVKSDLKNSDDKINIEDKNIENKNVKNIDDKINSDDESIKNKNIRNKNIQDKNIINDKNIENKNIENKNIEDKDVENKNIENKNIEDKDVEDKNIENKNIEDKNIINDKNIEDKNEKNKNINDKINIEDKNIENKNIEDKDVDDKDVEDKNIIDTQIINDKNIDDKNEKNKNIDDKINSDDNSIKSKNVKDKDVEDKNIKNKNVKDKNIEDKNIEDKNIIDTQIINDKNIADAQIIYNKNIENKNVIDTQIINNKNIADTQIIYDKNIADTQIIEDKNIINIQLINSDQTVNCDQNALIENINFVLNSSTNIKNAVKNVKYKKVDEETLLKINEQFKIKTDDVFVALGKNSIRCVSGLVNKIIESGVYNIVSVGLKAFSNEKFLRISYEYAQIVECGVVIEIERDLFCEVIANERAVFDAGMIGSCILKYKEHKIPGYVGNGKIICYVNLMIRKAIMELEGWIEKGDN